MRYARQLGLAVVAVFASACGDEREPPKVPPRPVSWFRLAEVDPGTLARHTGSVESWKKELVGFEVGGRVKRVIEPGMDIVGRVVDADGKVRVEGTVIAELEDERFRIALQRAEANRKSAKAQADAVQAEIDNTLPQQLKEAQEDRDFKQREFRRYEDLAKKGVESASELDQARRNYLTAQATANQVQATFTEKRAQLSSLEAATLRATELVNQAKKDLRDCKLYSPFSGQASKVHVIPGGFVTMGQPVVTVQLMDPMKVQVAVSGQTDEQIRMNDRVRVYLTGAQEPLIGSVHLKATVADSATRTFTVTLLVRNKKVDVDPPPSAAAGGLAVPYMSNPVTRVTGGDPPYYIEDSAIYGEKGARYVWAAEGFAQSDLYGTDAKAFTLRKVPVTLGEGVIPLVQMAMYLEVTSLGGLDPKSVLLAHGVPEGTTEGTKGYFARKVWVLRPGQLAHVDLRRGTLPAGLYVPMNAVLKEGETHSIFVAEDGSDGGEVARKVNITLEETYGEWRRITPAAGSDLAAGARIVLDGAHYLRDGAAINAFDEKEVKP